MWIVHLALRRPYTFVCVAILMLIFGVLSALRTPVDIFPAINIPVVSIVWNYGGLSPRDVEHDLANNFIRTPLATIQGLTIPPANGGVGRVINVDIDPGLLFANGLSPADVTTALGLQNVLLPSGTMKMGPREYFVRLNSTPDSLQMIGDMPIREVNGRTIFIRDVAQVRDGSAIQTTIVRTNGHRGMYLTMLKNGNVAQASTTPPALASVRRSLKHSAPISTPISGVMALNTAE